MVCLVLNGDLKAGVVLNTSFDILRGLFSGPFLPLILGTSPKLSSKINKCNLNFTA